MGNMQPEAGVQLSGAGPIELTNIPVNGAGHLAISMSFKGLATDSDPEIEPLVLGPGE